MIKILKSYKILEEKKEENPQIHRWTPFWTTANNWFYESCLLTVSQVADKQTVCRDCNKTFEPKADLKHHMRKRLAITFHPPCPAACPTQKKNLPIVFRTKSTKQTSPLLPKEEQEKGILNINFL